MILNKQYSHFWKKKIFPQNPSAESCASTPGHRIMAEQDGCHGMPLVREKKE